MRNFIVVSIVDDSQLTFHSELFTDTDTAFNEVNSFKRFHEDNDSLYEIRMSFFDNEKDALQCIDFYKQIDFLTSQ